MALATNYYFMLDELSEWVRELFSMHQHPALVYHNLVHTQQVVEKTMQIASNYKLDERNLFILKTAAWFHDCGHLFGPEKGHEIKSAVVMENRLMHLDAGAEIINQIKKCILATQLSTTPISLNEKIICDSDLYHLGTSQFSTVNELVKEEFKLRKGYIPQDWNWRTLKFLTTHTWFTPYCQALLDAGKQKNISWIKEMIANNQ